VLGKLPVITIMSPFSSSIFSLAHLILLLICAATITGSTARLISNLKPNALILGLCPDEKTFYLH